MLENFSSFLQSIKDFLPSVAVIVIAVLAYLIFNFLIRLLRKSLIAKAKTKKQIAGIEIFSKTSRYVLIGLLVFSAIFASSNAWTGLGLSLGLISAALGWALQKPITGMAAWLMIILRRPFAVGDRVIIGSVKGDVLDITLTHIYLREVGGIVVSEENSGRIVMVPNSILFEQNITNYTLRDEYVLDQVFFTITFESDLDTAMEICKKSVQEIAEKMPETIKRDPYIRNNFQPNGINVSVRYFVKATKLQGVSSKITEVILAALKNSDKVEFSYPHTEVILRHK